jgi:tyrosyl-tRNA synthetase
MNMTLSEELQWRGFVNQTTLADLKKLDEQSWTFYHGFDASADSQTVGNLAAMMFDKAFMRHGHKAVILAGGATSLIGDPGGKDKERPLQNEETIAHNVECAQEQLQRIYRGYDFTLVNNLDWFRGMTVIEFLRDIGKHFSMTPLVQRDYIANRMGEGGAGISYTEFSYTLLQGYDFLHLHKEYGVNLQLAGSDQWGNSISGVDLVRKATGEEVHIMTLPLVINKATGKKFGKSEDGAVWLDPKKTSPTQFYQFWVNSDDEGVEGYLKIFTELEKDEVEAIMTRHRENVRERHAQIRLAQEVTKLVHGETELAIAESVTEVLTGRKQPGDLNEQALVAMRGEIPSMKVRADAEIINILVTAGLASSRTEARRLVQGNSVSVNGEKTTKDRLEPEDFANGGVLIRKGKAFKDSAFVELVG